MLARVAYVLEAVLGRVAVLRTGIDRSTLSQAVLVPLEQGMALVPMTKALAGTVTDGGSTRALGFSVLPSGFDWVLAEWSVAGPVGYVEAEYFGGPGSQRAVLWSGGQLAFGPVAVGEQDPRPPEGTPISQVLARLGVSRGDHFDEFDAAGLGRHRRTDGWLPR